MDISYYERLDLKVMDLQIMIKNKGYTKTLKYLKIEKFFDFCIFNSLTAIDLTIACTKYVESEHEFERKFYIRLCSLFINEHLNKVHNLNNKFVLGFSELKVFEPIKEELHQIKFLYKEINKSKNYIHDIRVNTIAHRNTDAEKTYEDIKQIDDERIFELSNQVLKNLGSFAKTSIKVIQILIENFHQLDMKKM